jgi:putative tryptophan/tyrosine transport system substrate-binding protein
MDQSPPFANVSVATTGRSGLVPQSGHLSPMSYHEGQFSEAAKRDQDGVVWPGLLSSTGDPVRGRRRFIGATVGALLVAPFSAFAQQASSNLRRIGFLGSESASNQATRFEALRAGLRELGYVEGKNLVIEVRWAEGNYDRLPALAAELVGLKVAVVVTSGAKANIAMARATTTIPIVVVRTSKPIGQHGVITNLARPGGNITGWTGFGSELTAKRLELLREAMPRITRVAFLVNPADPPAYLSTMETAAKALKLELRPYEARAPGEFDSTIAEMVQRHVDAMVVQGDTMFTVNARAVADLAIKYRLPSVGIPEYADAGGMIGNGPDLIEGHRRAAAYVDKILKGADPGDLPIEGATKFQLVINLKTAKALGLTIPQSLLFRADELIQ